MKGLEVTDNGYLVFENQFFMVPNGLFDDKNDLTAYELLIFTYLMRCAAGGKLPFPSYATIALKCKVSARTAMRAIDGLETKGFITRQVRKDFKGNLSNLYRFANT